ncbi:MFS transporter [Nitratireductor mangrovi]|uniref:MFS transporter n=1 Tax=Nitratireductor mangrovi TaxID=2599600 RepID=A0A5B8KZ62_9HYPH|nr:MFS transporter [Nitratireductor mangrovi]QDZ00889.1 MFS transporter [Nitratireductor mangrovi]
MKTNDSTALPRGRDLSVAALGLAMLLASLGISITTVALPTLARDFSMSVTHVQWVVLGYLLSVTVAIVLCGRLGDMIGHRPVFLTGLAIFALSSLLCGIAPTLPALIAARIAQGIGGAVLMALPVSIVRDTVPTQRTGSAMGLLGTMSAVGTALGPSLGGLLIAWTGWRATFLVLAVMALLVLVFSARALPAKRPLSSGKGHGLDLPGAAVLTLTLLAFALAVTDETVFFLLPRGFLLLAAVLGTVAFVLVERRLQTPLVELAALGNVTTSAALLMNLLVSAVMMATLVVGPFYLAFALGLNDAVVGLTMAVGPTMAALSGIPAGRITDKFGGRVALVAGLVQTIVGLVSISVLPGLLGITGFVLSLMLLTPGYQLFLAANNTVAMLTARDNQRGMMSGLLGLSRNLGFMTGASVLGAVFAAAAGTADVTKASTEAVGTAFSLTFLVAAGFVTTALVVALFDLRNDRWGNDRAGQSC